MINTLRIRLNQFDPCDPILGGRWQVILVVDGSCGFSSKKFELIGVLQTTETNSLANQTYIDGLGIFKEKNL